MGFANIGFKGTPAYTVSVRDQCTEQGFTYLDVTMFPNSLCSIRLYQRSDQVVINWQFTEYLFHCLHCLVRIFPVLRLIIHLIVYVFGEAFCEADEYGFLCQPNPELPLQTADQVLCLYAKRGYTDLLACIANLPAPEAETSSLSMIFSFCSCEETWDILNTSFLTLKIVSGRGLWPKSDCCVRLNTSATKRRI